jgi:glycerol-3-phosphate cytidylyltransferase
MIKGITFGAFDLFHAGHVLMFEEAKTVCEHLIVCIQTDPSIDRENKNSPVQSIVERQIQVSGCRYVDEVLIYDFEKDVLDILNTKEWDIRIIGEEYKDQYFTGKELSQDKCHYSKREHNFSSSELRQRVADHHKNKIS